MTWSTGGTAIAAVIAGSTVRGAGMGSSTVLATLGDVAGSAALTVNPPQLQQVRIPQFLPVMLVPETAQFTATGSYYDATTQDLTTQATWTSATPSVATISRTGLVRTRMSKQAARRPFKGDCREAEVVGGNQGVAGAGRGGVGRGSRMA